MPPRNLHEHDRRPPSHIALDDYLERGRERPPARPRPVDVRPRDRPDFPVARRHAAESARGTSRAAEVTEEVERISEVTEHLGERVAGVDVAEEERNKVGGPHRRVRQDVDVRRSNPSNVRAERADRSAVVEHDAEARHHRGHDREGPFCLSMHGEAVHLVEAPQLRLDDPVPRRHAAHVVAPDAAARAPKVQEEQVRCLDVVLHLDVPGTAVEREADEAKVPDRVDADVDVLHSLDCAAVQRDVLAEGADLGAVGVHHGEPDDGGIRLRGDWRGGRGGGSYCGSHCG
mmetsp:Transcript_14908/g.59776  ORF Transcript_14908/g.59776 Transcript_14908/m.59776 type:complete len:288 (+) Transcript_14908:482-1345(+)